MYSGHIEDGAHQPEGVDLMLSLEEQGALFRWESVNSRILTAKFNTKKSSFIPPPEITLTTLSNKLSSKFQQTDRRAIFTLKNGKAAGSNEIAEKAFKADTDSC